MKKYIVEIRKDYNDCWDNYIDDYIEAETEIEAIDYAKQWLLENGMTEDEIENLYFLVKTIDK